MSNASASAEPAEQLTAEEKQLVRAPLVLNKRTMGWISDYISSIVEAKTPTWWYVSMAITVPLTILCLAMLVYLIATGVGVWGNNHPVGWAWDITNFVFWIGIGHAGTLISAILFLTRQKWRTSINRAAEAMTRSEEHTSELQSR
jgi:molybdopterin-containing oxidoreductase family membrane subunit